MIKESYNVVGVMSGTSLDGTDLAHIILTVKDGIWSYEILEAETVAYSDEWLQRLKGAIDFNGRQLEVLNDEYTVLLSSIINNFIVNNHITDLDAVCSHGHTIVHRPEESITLQIGNLPQIVHLTGQRVVCDFRVADVLLGGQGAPLVPVGDRLLFADYNYCLNLGGFSNISFEENGRRIAFDICPVNTVLNYYANLLGYDYDDGGSIAAGGKVNNNLLNALNGLDFYKAPYPKSLGFEFVKQEVLPLMHTYSLTPQDNLATFTEHIAVQITSVVNRDSTNATLLITGGGAYNALLVKRMQALMPGISITVPNDKTIQFKEALIFALLGVLKLRGEVNTLASVTGAPHDHSGGVIYT